MAFEKEGVAWVRKTSRAKLKKRPVVLKELNSNNQFSGEYFKIVIAKSDNAIMFSDKKYHDKASHVYHHLTIAKNYFIKNYGSEYLDTIKPIIIRLDIINEFHDTAKYNSTKNTTRFNDAATIPASNADKHPSHKDWRPEIWFRPKKTEKNKNAVAKLLLQ